VAGERVNHLAGNEWRRYILAKAVLMFHCSAFRNDGEGSHCERSEAISFLFRVNDILLFSSSFSWQ